jgi:hypothetical protein
MSQKLIFVTVYFRNTLCECIRQYSDVVTVLSLQATKK